MQRKFVYNFNVLNKYGNEWDDFFSCKQFRKKIKFKKIKKVE